MTDLYIQPGRFYLRRFFLFELLAIFLFLLLLGLSFFEDGEDARGAGGIGWSAAETVVK